MLIFTYQPKKFSDEIDKAIEDIRACKITCWHKWYASRELSAVALAQCNIFQACFACVTALTTGWYAGAVLCVHLLETAQTQECGFIVQCCLPFQCTNSKMNNFLKPPSNLPIVLLIPLTRIAIMIKQTTIQAIARLPFLNVFTLLS